MYRLLLAALALAGCIDYPDNPPGTPPPNWEEAAEYAWDRMRIDPNEPAPISGTNWVEGCIPWKEHCAQGVMWSCHRIYVQTNDLPSKTSLTHEYMHCNLKYDDEHTSECWEEVRVINRELKAMGL